MVKNNYFRKETNKMKSVKLVTLILSLALLVGSAVAVFASADEQEKIASMKYTTLNYGADTRIVYALNLTGTSAENVVLKLYKTPDLSDTPTVAEFSGEYIEEVYPVYYSMGISAKDIAEAIYALPCDSESGEALGEACRYSVLEYCYNNINGNASEDLKALSEDLLEYGKSAQTRLINIGNLDAEEEILIADYCYVKSNDASVVFTDKNGYKTRLFAPDEEIRFSYNGEGAPEKWQLTYKDGSGAIVAAADVAESYANLVEASPIIGENTGTRYDFEDGKIIGTHIKQYYNSTGAVTEITGDENSESYDGEYVDYSVIADTPADAANKALKVTLEGSGVNKNPKTDVYVSSENTDGTDYVFEARLNVDPSGVADNAEKTVTYIYFYNSSGKQVFYFYLHVSKITGKVTLIHSSTTDSSNTTVREEMCSFDFNTWTNIRIELHTSSVLEENRVRVYIGADGEAMTLTRELNTYAHYQNSIIGSGLSYCSINYMRNITNTYYLDNLYFICKK